MYTRVAFMDFAAKIVTRWCFSAWKVKILSGMQFIYAQGQEVPDLQSSESAMKFYQYELIPPGN